MTLTLPDRIIDALGDVDRDLSRAVVRLTLPQISKGPRPAAELATFGKFGVIVVTPTRTLERRTGVMLVPLSDGRALIAFDESMTPARLELKIDDELEDRTLPAEDAQVFARIRDLLRDTRRSRSIALRQRNIIVLEYAGKASKRP